MVLVNDNDESRNTIEQCYRRRKTVLNPIIDWDDEDVWEFIHEYNVPYCELYDKGFKRLGCIGCPLGRSARKEFMLYPRYKQAYMRAFEKMLIYRREKGLETKWETPQDVMDWWMEEIES